jgi:hypothetical protein
VRVALQNVRVVIHPELTIRQERDRCVPRAKVLAVLGDQEVKTFEDERIDVIHDP